MKLILILTILLGFNALSKDNLIDSMVISNAESSKILRILIEEIIDLETYLEKTEYPRGKVKANKILSVLPETKDPKELIDQFFKYQANKYKQDRIMLEKVQYKRQVMNQILKRIQFNNELIKKYAKGGYNAN